jgi:hypothetical protein
MGFRKDQTGDRGLLRYALGVILVTRQNVVEK